MGIHFIRLGMFVLLGGHGDAYLVVAEGGNYCGAAYEWAAARVRWQPADLVGGEWVVSEIIDGGVD